MGAEILNRVAEQVMTSDPETVSPLALAATALELMNKKAISVLFVTSDDGEPIGILHMHDVVRAGII